VYPVPRPLAIKMDIQGSEPCRFLGGAQIADAADLLLTELYDAEAFLDMIGRTFKVGDFAGEKPTTRWASPSSEFETDPKIAASEIFDLVFAKERRIRSRKRWSSISNRRTKRTKLCTNSSIAKHSNP
jgi:hypothetical protein